MLNVALIGIEGFGRAHVRQIVAFANEGKLRCAAFADPGADPAGESFAALTALGAVRCDDDATLLAERPDVDAVVLATPLPLHRAMAIRALEAGRHVLVEKPPAVAVQDVDAMARAQEAAGRLCAVNFQNVSGSAFRRALELVRAGAIGRVSRIAGIGMWKRTDRYYSRTPWAGKLTLRGQLVLDGTLMNPFAHLLQNGLLLAEAAAADPADAEPLHLRAELYRAHPIEGDDTSCLRLATRGGVEVCMYTTLCYESNEPPAIEVVGDRGVLRWDYANRLEIRRAGGSAPETLQFPAEDLMRKMYSNWIDSIDDRAEPYCTVDRCRPFVAAVNGALLSSGGVHPIPADAVDIAEEHGNRVTTVRDLPELFREAAERSALLSELGVPWAVRTRRFSLEGFREFRL
ncbi:Gfo/Idh/MocA family protein [Paenibacillus antri]|nr:Gfo/Idh/MocA family oxidoreductase [Paenibacillus antri]